MSQTATPTEQAEFVTFAGQLIQKESRVHLNVGQEFIVTTDDKIRLCLSDHLSRMEKRRAWITPLGIFLTLLIVFPTTTFRAFIVGAETWQALFIICAVISLCWLLYSVYQARVSTSINEVMADIKRTAIVGEAADAIPSPSFEPVGSPIPSMAQEDLIVDSARYGAEDQWNDVTELLQSKVSAGRLELDVSNDSLGGDPTRGVHKTLVVEYSYRGIEHRTEIPEHRKLSLPVKPDAL